jgi:hypothetical protein
MKATELIKEVQEMINKYGEELEVFIEAPGMNYEQTFNVRSIGDYVHTDVLSDYPENLIYEYHGEEGDREGPGLVYGVVLIGDELIDTCG